MPGPGTVDIEAGDDPPGIDTERDSALEIASARTRSIKEGYVPVAGTDEAMVDTVVVVLISRDRLVRGDAYGKGPDTAGGISRCIEGFASTVPLPLHPRLAQPRGEPRAPPIWLDHHFEFFPAAISHVVVREATRAEEDLPPPLSTRLPFPLGRTFPSSRV